MVACVVQGLALRGVQEDHSFVLTNAGEKENDRVKAIKRMLTGIMLMLMAISFAVGNGDRGTWLGEGQVLIGAFACVACMFNLGGKIPNWLLIILMFISSVGAGALWAVIHGRGKMKT